MDYSGSGQKNKSSHGKERNNGPIDKKIPTISDWDFYISYGSGGLGAIMVIYLSFSAFSATLFL